MSDLDEKLFAIIVDDDLSSDDKCRKIQSLYKINSLWHAIEAEDKYRLNLHSFCKHCLPNSEDPIPANAVTTAVLARGGLELVKLLVDYGYDPSQALYAALFVNDPDQIDIVHYLLIRGASTQYVENQFKTQGSTYAIAKHFSSIFLEGLQAKLALDDAIVLFNQINPAHLHQYASFLAKFSESCQFDTTFVIQFLCIGLQDIALGKKTEAELSYLPAFTKILFKILTHPIAPDETHLKLFNDILQVEWLGFKFQKPGLFKSTEELESFYHAIGFDKPKIRFEIGIGVRPEDSETKESKQSIYTQIKLTGSPLHKKIEAPLPKAAELKEEKTPNYFEAFFNLSDLERIQMLKNYRQQHEGFDGYIIDRSVTFLLRSLCVDNFQSCLVGPTVPQNEWYLENYINVPLGNEVRYTFFALVTTNEVGLHAVAVVIDKKTKEIFCVDPEMNRYGGQSEAEMRLENAIKSLHQLDGFKIILPPPASIPPQSVNDFYNCGVFTAIIIIGIILKQEKICLHHPTHSKMDEAMASIEVDFAKAKLPKPQFLDTYLGVLLCAYQDSVKKYTNDDKRNEARLFVHA